MDPDRETVARNRRMGRVGTESPNEVAGLRNLMAWDREAVTWNRHMRGVGSGNVMKGRV